MVLDLGNVRDLASVRVNGKALGTLWLGPWTVDVTGAVQPGRNTLEVEIVNAWNNRLVGDANLPADQRRGPGERAGEWEGVRHIVAGAVDG